MTKVYSEHTLSSGTVVQIRPRTYEEWEAHEDERLQYLERLRAMQESGSVTGLDVEMFKGRKELRGKMLACWIKDFDNEKTRLRLPDIAEIEREASKMESEEIPLGNFDAGEPGQ